MPKWKMNSKLTSLRTLLTLPSDISLTLLVSTALIYVGIQEANSPDKRKVNYEGIKNALSDVVDMQKVSRYSQLFSTKRGTNEKTRRSTSLDSLHILATLERCCESLKHELKQPQAGILAVDGTSPIDIINEKVITIALIWTFVKEKIQKCKGDRGPGHYRPELRHQGLCGYEYG